MIDVINVVMNKQVDLAILALLTGFALLTAHQTAFAIKGKMPWVENDFTWNFKTGNTTSIVRDSEGHVK
jgi:hypothetical protein